MALFHRASRLSRGGMLDTFLLKDRIEAAGATMRFVEGDIANDDTGELLLGLYAWKEAKDRDQILRQTRAGMRARVASGKPLVNGRPPYGYQWFDPEKKKGRKPRLVLDPETSPNVRLIFDLALSGTSLRGIAAELAKRGIPSPTGKPRWAIPRSVPCCSTRSTPDPQRPIVDAPSAVPAEGTRPARPGRDEQVLLPNIARANNHGGRASSGAGAPGAQQGPRDAKQQTP